MKTFNSTRTGNNQTRKADYHIVEQAGRFKVYDAAGRFRLTFATRDAAQAYIDGKHQIDGHAVFQVAASAAIALLLLLWPLVADAAPRCPNGGQVDGKGRCVYVWRGATCYRVGNVVWCVTPAQPGEVQP